MGVGTRDLQHWILGPSKTGRTSIKGTELAAVKSKVRTRESRGPTKFPKNKVQPTQNPLSSEQCCIQRRGPSNCQYMFKAYLRYDILGMSDTWEQIIGNCQ